MNRLLIAPDDMVRGALRRLKGTPDAERVYEWMFQSLAKLDAQNRTLTDGVPLRQGQGAAQLLAEFLEVATEEKVTVKPALNTGQRSGSA